MIWYETDSNWLWQRNEADSAWVRLLYVDQSGSLSLLDETKIVNAAGVQQGLLGDQATGTWETGTSTTESLVSPAKVKAAVDAFSVYGLKAMAVFSASGGSISIGKSSNVSSVVRTAEGLYTISFTSNAPDTNYGLFSQASHVDSAGVQYESNVYDVAVGSFKIATSGQGTSTSSTRDNYRVSIAAYW